MEGVIGRRSLKPVLLVVGLLQLILAAGFLFQQSWAISLWPGPDTRLSYAFIALSEQSGGLAGYGFSFGIMYGGMALLGFALFIGVAAALCALLYFRTPRDMQDSQPTPRLVRLAFMLEVLVLAGAGLLLLLKVPNTLPWNLSPESSVLYGWVFLGPAFYYLYAVLKPQWIHALGPLLGFLAYDLVLFSPLFARFGNLQPEHVRGQAAASVIIIFSAALGVYYLFVNPATRLGARDTMRRTRS